MIRKRLALLLGLLAAPGLAQPVADPAYGCKAGAQLPYPLTESIRALQFDLKSTDTVNFLLSPAMLEATGGSAEEIARMRQSLLESEQEQSRQREGVLTQLASWPPARRDATLLAAIDQLFHGTRPMISLTTLTDAHYIPLYLDVLERNGLTEQAALARQALGLFGTETDPFARYDLWSDGRGGILDPALDDQIMQIEARLAPLRPPILQAAEHIVRSDPDLLKVLTEEASHVGEDTYLFWMTGKIAGCAGDWYASVDQQDPFAALPQAQHDLMVLDIFMAEMMNGGVHQFFSNSSGGLAPEVLAILQREGLSDHAAEMQLAMEMLGDPYPRDRDLRNAAMAGFTDVQHDALNAPTGIMDDGQVYQTMLKIARESGLMVQ